MISLTATFVLVLFFSTAFLFLKKVYSQYSEIAFYEKQGVLIYPTSWKLWYGAFNTVIDFQKARASECVKEDLFQWLSNNIQRYGGKKEEYAKWNPVSLIYSMGKSTMMVCDPEVIEDIQKDHSILEKKSDLGRIIFDTRLKDNILSMDNCQEQIQRRRAIVTALTGTKNFCLLDKIIQDVLTAFTHEMKTKNEDQIINLRKEIFSLFERFVSQFLVGRDITNNLITMNVIEDDGTIVKKEQNCFAALVTSLNASITAFPIRELFGERRIGQTLSASLENWETLCNFMDSIVKDQMQIFSSKPQDSDPTCLTDVMMTLEVYNKTMDHVKITNDLIITMLGMTDTGRNVIAHTLCYFTKSKEAREKIRGEIDTYMNSKDISDVLKLGHKDLTPSNFVYLHQVINESLRLNPPVQSIDQSRLVRDCKLGKYHFKKDQLVIFQTVEVHQNPNEWFHPEKFLPDRFDPAHSYFKTPSGKERNPSSFIPFYFGNRKCLGYQFAGKVLPSIITKVVHNFDFQFEDRQWYEEDKFPLATVALNQQYPINVKVMARS